MDARYYNGDDDRDHPSVPDRCVVCGWDLERADEIDQGLCVRCAELPMAERSAELMLRRLRESA